MHSELPHRQIEWIDRVFTDGGHPARRVWGICNITKTPDRSDTVNDAVQHYGTLPFSLADVPVLPSCGSRVFSVRIVASLVSGDDVKIDGAVPYDATSGETRTYAMAANSGFDPEDVEAAFQDAHHKLDLYDSHGVTATSWDMAPGTSPSMVKLTSGPTPGFMVAFVGSDGFLWSVGPDGQAGRVGSGLEVAAGTSPAIAIDSRGVPEIAFNGRNGHLWTYGGFPGKAVDTWLDMRADSSPAIGGRPTGGFEIAFVGTDGFLYTIEPNGTGKSTFLGVQPGTDPAIAIDSRDFWKIAFHASGDSDHLWTYDSHGKAVNTLLIMRADSSPSIAALGTGGGDGGTGDYEIAIAGADGFLYAIAPNISGKGSFLGVAPGTNPSITYDQQTHRVGDWKIAFHASGDSDHLWTWNANGTAINTDTSMASGSTSPSLTLK